ncbi:MAG: carbohydrate-binding protein [Opitutaceae bacterium]
MLSSKPIRLSGKQPTAAILAALGVFLSTQLHAQYTFDGSVDSDWNTGANWTGNSDITPDGDVPSAPDNEVPGTTGTDHAVINGGSTVDLSSAVPSIRALRLEGGSGTATLNILEGAQIGINTSSPWDSSIGRSGASGIVNQSGGDIDINFLEVGRDSGVTGTYNLSGGIFNIGRGGNGATGGSSLIMGTADSSTTGSGDGTFVITGGSFTTRAGVWIGTTGATGVGRFSVLGSGATQIGVGTQNTGTDGNWTLNNGSTLEVGVDLGGLTQILVDDHGNGNNFAIFEAGSLLDVDYYNGGYGGGTWTVLELENGDIVDNGLALAPGVDTAIWSLSVDNTGTNGLLTVTAVGDPAGILGNWFTIQAEDFDNQSGTQLESTGDEGGGDNVAYISNNDWLLFENVTLGDNALLNFRVARNTGTDASHIEVRQGSQTGALIAQVDVPETGGWQTYQTVSVPVVATVSGQQDIYLVFVETDTANGGSLFNLNWWSKTAMVEAENYTAAAGQRFEDTQDVGGGQNLGWVADGEWLDYTIEVENAGSHRIDFRVAGDNSDGSINMVSGGQTIGSINIGNTGGWQSWQTVSTYVDFPNTGSQTVRLEMVVPSAGFNLNWFSYIEEAAPEPLTITVGNTPKQQMRYGIDYERLWYWTGADAVKDLVAQWSVDDADVDFVRVAMNAKYELDEGVFDLNAYDGGGGYPSNDRIIPMMQDMQAANPDVKFFASPRPLNESHNSIPVAKDDIPWQPYPIWITGASSYTSNSYDFNDIKCAEYMVKYLLLMKSYGLQISYMDVTNEWQSNVGGGRVTQDDMDDIHEYLHVTYMAAPWEHPDYPGITLTPSDIPQLVAPSSWNYSQGDQWVDNLDDGDKEAISIVASHNTDRTGTAQDVVDAVNNKFNQPGDTVPEVWNTELHGWKSTSNADEVLTYAYMLECINAGFSGLSGWLARGTSSQGHSYFDGATPTVKYYMFKKLTNTSNRGYALDVNEPDELKVYWDGDPDQEDADSAVSALIRGNLMTVWVLNHSIDDYTANIIPTGRTISDEPIKFTRWSQHDGVDVEGETGTINASSDTAFYATVQDNSAYCFEILLEPETVPYARIEAEAYDDRSDVAIANEACSDIDGGFNISNLNDGYWTKYNDIDLNNATSIRLRVARPDGQAEGKIEVRIGSPTGTLIGRAAVPATGGWQSWTTLETTLDETSGTHDLYLVYIEAKSNQVASSAMFNLNWFEITEAQTPSSIAEIEAPVSDTQVTLTWNAVPGAIGYTVKRSETQGSGYATVDDTITATTYTDSDLTPGVTYYYVIVARYGNGEESEASGEIVATPSNPIVLEELSFEAPDMNIAGDSVGIGLLNSEPGHLYQAQEKKALTDEEWMNVGDPIPGNNGVIEFDFPVGPSDTHSFYRITIFRQ